MNGRIRRDGRAAGILAAGVVLAAICAGLSSGCVSHRYFPYDANRAVPPDPALSTRASPFFSIGGGAPEYLNHVMPNLDTGTHIVRQIQFPSAGDNGQRDNLVTGLYYQSRKREPGRLVIILPIWGSYTYPSEKITNEIVERYPDTHVFRMLGKEFLLDWEALAAVEDEHQVTVAARRIADRMRVGVINVRQIVAWAIERPEVDPRRIGIVGFSIGAVVASIALGNEPELDAGVLVMGAAKPEEIVAVCPGRLGKAREHVLSKFGWSVAQFRTVFAKAFAPLSRSYPPGSVDASRVLMIDSYYDRCMPKEARDDLWVRMGRPERITFNYGHKTSFLAMTPLGFNYMRKRILEFLDNKL